MLFKKMVSKNNEGLVPTLRLLNDLRELNEERLSSFEYKIELSDMYHFMAEEKFVIFVKVFPNFYDESKKNNNQMIDMNIADDGELEINSKRYLRQNCIEFIILFDYKFPYSQPVIYHKKFDNENFTSFNGLKNYEINHLSNIIGMVDLKVMKDNLWLPENNINSLIFNLYLHVKNHLENNTVIYPASKSQMEIDSCEHYCLEMLNRFDCHQNSLNFIRKITTILSFVEYKVYSDKNMRSSEIFELKTLDNRNIVNKFSYEYNNEFHYSEILFKKLISRVWEN